ncbi:retrovirus-related Pol polyprotein from transposon 17.6 [Trichonephila clavipes]|nr:retrovirus-related Pol polyprotein from transposon 17.6 [Trichonephila clavipes]
MLNGCSTKIQLTRDKEILPPVGPCSRISPVTKINSSTLFAKQQNSEELGLINSEVFSKTNVDACGPMPISTEGNKCLITVMCLASKYPDAIPVPEIASKSVVNALLQVWPWSSVYHPQSNLVERFHRTVKRVLRVLCIEAAPNRESQVLAALFALRTVTHESTGFSPAELLYGNNLRTPVTLLYESRLDPEEKVETVVEYVFELINRLKKCRDLATVKMEEVRERRKKWYDKNAIKRGFQQGDAVLVLSLNQPHKLAPQWKGPGKIEKRLSETNYVVTFDGNQEGNKVYHINMLKPYHRRPELLNVVLVDTEEITESSELEEDFPYMLTDPNVFDFREIVENKLKERLGDEQIMQLGKLLVKFSAIFSNIPGKTNLVEHDIDLISDKRV